MEKHSQFLFLAFITLVIFLTSCKKMDDMYRQFIEEGEIVYIAKADSVEVRGGNQRIALSWLLLSDPKVRSYTVYWDNRSDSVSNSVRKTSDIDTVHLVLDNMSEGLHYFEIYMYDKDGHSSVKSEVIGSSYGSLYQESLLTRTIRNMRRIGDDIEIDWTSASIDLLHVELHYKNDKGDSIIQIIPKDKSLDTLKRISAYPDFEYRSAFLPDSTAIDTFYTSYTVIDFDQYINEKGMNLSFETNVNYGSQENQLSILVSTDFSGKDEISEIHAATWIEITDSFLLATSSSYQFSGSQDLVQYLEKGKPLYVAFRYTTLPQGDNGVQRTWKIQNFEIKNKEGGILLDYADASFTLTHEGPFESGRSSLSSSVITLRGNTKDVESRTEDWTISKAIHF